MVAAPPSNPGEADTGRESLDAASLFAGAAPYYLRYRPRYPDALFVDLVERCRVSRGQRVLDLGCGPGFLAVPLAALGARVTAVDPQPDMLATGHAAARELGCDSNITWVEATAEEFAAQSAGSDAAFRCATLGRSFHWMQREAVLTFLDRVLEASGSVVIVGEDRPDDIAWRAAVRDYSRDWYGGEIPADALNSKRRSGRSHEDVLRNSAFSRITTLAYPVARHWTVDDIVGYVFSTSSGNPALLGDGIGTFEAGLRQRLAALPGAPHFDEELDIVAAVATRPPCGALGS